MDDDDGRQVEAELDHPCHARLKPLSVNHLLYAERKGQSVKVGGSRDGEGAGHHPTLSPQLIVDRIRVDSRNLGGVVKIWVAVKPATEAFIWIGRPWIGVRRGDVRPQRASGKRRNRGGLRIGAARRPA